MMTTGPLPSPADILTEPAGRKLDAWVATHVMAQPWQGGNPIPSYDGRWPWPPPYSTDIAAAMQVAAELRRRGFVVRLELLQETAHCLATSALGEPVSVHAVVYDHGNDFLAALCVAVCRAALLA
jgi:hypothetical protein